MWPLHNQSYCNISMKNGSNVIIVFVHCILIMLFCFNTRILMFQWCTWLQISCQKRIYFFCLFRLILITSIDNISASNHYWINIYKTSKWGISTQIDAIMSFNFSFFQQGSYNYGNKKMWHTKIHVHKYIYIFVDVHERFWNNVG